MSSDEDEEGSLGRRLQSPTSDDDPPATIIHQPSNPVLRQPVGFYRNTNNLPVKTYNVAPSAPPTQYLPGQEPPPPLPKPARKSKSRPSKSKREPRAPISYIPYLPGDPPPREATLAAAKTAGALTFVGDPTLYMTTDRNKLPPRAERDLERAKKNKDNINYYEPVDKVYKNRKRIMPYPPDPEGDGNNVPPGYADGPSNTQYQQYEQDPYQESQLSQSSSGSGHRKQHHSRRHRDHPDDHPNDRGHHYAPHSKYKDNHSHHHQRPLSSIAPPSQQYPYGHPGVPVSTPVRPPTQLRILTLLIEDLRRDNGEKDQLAEIRVPLKTADNPEDGFWADAKEVCKELQSGPARIDGPAKAFTRRGKYRQYFLRVTAGGTDEYASANLRVDKDRTLQVMVEGSPNALETAIHSPRLMTPISVNGAASSPFPLGSLKRKHDDMPRSLEHQEAMPFAYSSPQSQYTQMSPAYPHQSLYPPVIDDVTSPMKKQKKSPTTSVTSPADVHATLDDWGESLTDIVGGTAPSPKQNKSPLPFHPETSNLHFATQPAPSPLNPDNIISPKLEPQLDRIRSTPSYSGLITGSESHKHTKTDVAVIHWLKSIITHEQGWDDFVESRKNTLSVRQQMKHFRFVQDKCDQWVGTRTPQDLEDVPSEVITKTQVIGVFGLPLSWGETCTETLDLTKLYGPGGLRLEDERVMAMLDEHPVVGTGMQVKEYLKLLRQIDQQWDHNHGGDG